MVKILVVAFVHIPAVRLGAVEIRMVGLNGVADLLRSHALWMISQNLPYEVNEAQGTPFFLSHNVVVDGHTYARMPPAARWPLSCMMPRASVPFRNSPLSRIIATELVDEFLHGAAQGIFHLRPF